MVGSRYQEGGRVTVSGTSRTRYQERGAVEGAPTAPPRARVGGGAGELRAAMGGGEVDVLACHGVMFWISLPNQDEGAGCRVQRSGLRVEG